MQSADDCTAMILFTWIASTIIALIVGYQFGRNDEARDPRPNVRRP